MSSLSGRLTFVIWSIDVMSAADRDIIWIGVPTPVASWNTEQAFDHLGGTKRVQYLLSKPLRGTEALDWLDWEFWALAHSCAKLSGVHPPWVAYWCPVGWSWGPGRELRDPQGWGQTPAPGCSRPSWCPDSGKPWKQKMEGPLRLCFTSRDE